MRTHNRLVRSSVLILVLLAWLGIPQAGSAHPMGNFSISHYSAIRIQGGNVEVRYFIDMAEIPTFQEIQSSGIVAQVGDPSLAPYLAQEANILRAGLLLEIDGQQVELRTVDQDALFTSGAGGLPTMKLGLVYRAPVENLSSGSAHRIHYLDNNFAGHSGWKEIVVIAGDGVSLLSSSAPTTDRSAQLSNYPTDLLNSPPQDLEAAAEFKLPQVPFTSPASTSPASTSQVPPSQAAAKPIARPATPSASVPHLDDVRPQAKASAARPSLQPTPPTTDRQPRTPQPDLIDRDSAPAPAVGLQANQQKTPRSRFTELVSARNMSFWFLFSAALIAAGLGALHALEPGHGKTIVAAYLVGTRGTSRHAVLLGLIVTAAHTAGVYLLGGITLYASRWIVPEQLYPWLGVISGLMIAGLASYLFLRACTGESEAHGHQAGQSHSHWFASLTRSQFVERTSAAAPATAPSTAGTSEPADASVPLRQLLTLGITGGMVPCPAALVVLLSALSLHRVGLGLFLIVAFSLGLAAVLIVIGLLMVYARQFMARWKGDGLVSKRWLPALSSGFMLILGLGIAAKGLLSTGIGSGFLSRGHVASFAGIVLLGLFLGMRHSTDPDHVVAVSTIVSRERSLRYAALIGMLWGVGHTLTISLVGSAIILFNLVIPPRVGLSMELSVAIMLILLGVLNLTGVVRWLTEKFTPPAQPAAQSAAQSRAQSPAQSPVRPAAPNGTSMAGSSLDRVVGRFGLYQLLRPLVVGLIHGLAGSAAVALLVLSTIHSPLWAIAYLVVFGVGTIAGMMLMTTAIALPIAYTGNRFARAGNYLGVASGIVSTAFGMFLIYQIGLVDGLFTGQAHWIPR